MNFYYQVLESLHNNSGTLVYNNKLITGSFIKGGAYGYEGKVEVQVKGLDLVGAAVLDSNCFGEDCLFGSGIWTSAVTTSIKDDNGLFFLQGLVDEQGAVWTVDFITVCLDSGRKTIVDRLVPLNYQGIGKSTSVLPPKLKIAELIKTTSDSSQVMLTIYGDFNLTQQPTLTKPFCQGKRDYTFQGQYIDIEETALTIVSLMLNDFHFSQDREKRFAIKGEVDNLFSAIISDNYDRLSKLIDLDSINKRYGSIPKYLASYVEYKNLYSDGDGKYNNPVVTLHNTDCFDSGCFDEINANNLNITRWVSTRAIAWLAFSLSLYKKYFISDTYDDLLNKLVDYLIEQISDNYLLTDGWLHNDTLVESERLHNYSLSTNVVSYLVFFQLFDITSKAFYHELGISIYEAILNNFYSFKTNSFSSTIVDSKINFKENDLSVLVYGLLFSKSSGREDITEKLIDKLGDISKSNYGSLLFEYSPDSTEYETVDYLTKNLRRRENLKYLDKLNYLSTETRLNPTDLVRELYLLRELLINSQDNFDISERLISNLSTFNNFVSKDLYCNSTFVVSDLIDKTLSKHFNEIFVVNTDYIESGVFYRSFNFSKIKKWIPINFSWFSEDSMLPGSQLSKFLKSISYILSTFNVLKKRWFSNDILNYGYLELLIEAAGLNVQRLIQETSREFAQYLSSFFNSNDSSNTASGITMQVDRYNYDICIEEKWQDIVTPNGLYDERFNSVLGKSYISGENKYSAYLINVTAFRPLRDIIQLTINTFKPAGVKVIYDEILGIEDSIQVFNNNCLLLSYTDIPPECSILTEDGSYLLSQNQEFILLEQCNQEELITECGILSELGNYILEEEINSNLVLENNSCISSEIECTIILENNSGSVFSQDNIALVLENNSCDDIPDNNSYIVQEDFNKIKTEIDNSNILVE